MLNQERKTQIFMSCSITFSEHYIHGNREVRVFFFFFGGGGCSERKGGLIIKKKANQFPACY